MMKRELSQKEKLSIYQSIYVPTLTYGHDQKNKTADTIPRNGFDNGLMDVELSNAPVKRVRTVVCNIGAFYKNIVSFDVLSCL